MREIWDPNPGMVRAHTLTCVGCMYRWNRSDRLGRSRDDELRVAAAEER
jgi:hypothetical protein